MVMRRAEIAVVWLVLVLAPAFAAEPENKAAGENAGQTVQLQLKLPEGVNLPADFKPQVYLEDATERPQFQPWKPKSKEEAATDSNQLTVEAKGDGAFEFQLADPA